MASLDLESLGLSLLPEQKGDRGTIHLDTSVLSAAVERLRDQVEGAQEAWGAMPPGIRDSMCVTIRLGGSDPGVDVEDLQE